MTLEFRGRHTVVDGLLNHAGISSRGIWTGALTVPHGLCHSAGGSLGLSLFQAFVTCLILVKSLIAWTCAIGAAVSNSVF